ncbi:MAG: hypothetical protein JWN46_1554 [Acidimicrobiales bacterium]|nr:hypothetical protein [Acidimicrobiales bacterium]
MSDVIHQEPSTVDAARSAAADTASTAAEQGKAVAGAAVDQAKDVAVQAREQLGTVTDEAKHQAQRVLSDTSSQLESQLEDRLGTLAGSARSTAGELRALVEGRPQDAGRARDLAAQAADRLDRVADRTEQLGVRGMAEEVSELARRRPVAFLFGAAAAGLLVGRMARAGKEATSSDGSSSANGSSLAPTGGQNGFGRTSLGANGPVSEPPMTASTPVGGAALPVPGVPGVVGGIG